MDINSNSYPWVIFTLDQTKFAISSEKVLAMERTPRVVEVPQIPGFCRGVINFRGRVIPLIDLRVRFGLSSLLDEMDEFCAVMDTREQDHLDWLAELESSIRERREFKLTTDPHLCAFGKWYDQYTSQSYTMRTLLRKFEVPHRRIHQLAEKVKELETAGEISQAAGLIDHCRDTDLASMRRTFTAVKDEYRSSYREIAIIYKDLKIPSAITVDAVEGIEKLSAMEDQGETGGLAAMGDNDIVIGAAKRTRSTDDEIIFALDHRRLLTDS